jgi:hypothetical protein
MNSPCSELCGELRLVWTAAGSVRQDPDGKIRFPALKKCSGLYRFLVNRIDGSRAVYVGESDNLQRRFTHYRNPGPSQTTNIRINTLFVDVLSEGGFIEVEVVIDQAWIKADGEEKVASFDRKDMRRLFENFILVTQSVVEIEDLNK